MARSTRERFGLRPSVMTQASPKDLPVYFHGFKWWRIVNWVPVGLAYAIYYMGRYNLNVAQSALGEAVMTRVNFGDMFAAGAVTYALTFLISGPFTDRYGGRLAMLIGTFGTLVANLLMGLTVWGYTQGMPIPIIPVLTVLFCLNMAFQTFGATAIVVVNAPWFHVRERGRFGTIFGAFISAGVYFAFDWGYSIVEATRAQIADPSKLSFVAKVFRFIFNTGDNGVNQTWWLFFTPAILLGVLWVIMFFTTENEPAHAGFKNFPTGREDMGDKPLPLKEVLWKIITHRMFGWVCIISVCTGVMRNAAIQWYPKVAEAVGFKHDLWITHNWGLTMLICGVSGGILTGWCADKFFQSRRGPMLAVMYGVAVAAVLMLLATLSLPYWVSGIAAVVLFVCVFGSHSTMAATITADFGGKNTGTSVGAVDGLVYLGMGIQSFLIGQVAPQGEAAHTLANWTWWPGMLVPVAILGFILAYRLKNVTAKAGGH